MFYFIRGLVALSEPGLVVIDANGVGYGIMTSLNSSSMAETGKEATFYTYLHVREDIFDLYGFITQEELACFKQLISISGVGPKAALSVLGVTTPASLATAVVQGNEKALSAAPGVGKKLAQRIILELKDKMSKLGIDPQAGTDVAAGALYDISSPAAKDAADALTVLGYGRQEVSAALRGIDTEGMSVEDIIKAALKRLF